MKLRLHPRPDAAADRDLEQKLAEAELELEEERQRSAVIRRRLDEAERTAAERAAEAAACREKLALMQAQFEAAQAHHKKEVARLLAELDAEKELREEANALVLKLEATLNSLITQHEGSLHLHLQLLLVFFSPYLFLLLLSLGIRRARQTPSQPSAEVHQLRRRLRPRQPGGAPCPRPVQAQPHHRRSQEPPRLLDLR